MSLSDMRGRLWTEAGFCKSTKELDVVGVEKLQEEPELDGQCLGHVSRIRW